MESCDSLQKPCFKSYLKRFYGPVLKPSKESTGVKFDSHISGIYLSQPNTEKFNEHGRGNGLRYGVSCMQGWVCDMEDTHNAVISLGQDRGIWRNTSLVDWSYFGVFDGRAGDTASSYCADQLIGAIIYSPEFQEDIVKGIRAGFLRLDNRLRHLPDAGNGRDHGSSTAVCVFISPFNIYVAHCGDSRAVLYSNGQVTLETRDHKPSTPGERERIVKAGGIVTLTDKFSGLMSLSRSFGDFRYKNLQRNPKDFIVISEPDIQIVRRDRKDNFLVLASNGVWDVMSANEVCDYLSHMMKITEDLEYIGNSLINTCLHKGSRDNITVIIVALPGHENLNEKTIYLDKKVDILIERKVKEILTLFKRISLSQLIEMLLECHIPHLPPGGSLSSKMHLVESIYNEVRPYQTDTTLSLSNILPSDNELEEVILF